MTPLFKKLNLKDQKVLHVIQAPESFIPELNAIQASVAISTSAEGRAPIAFLLAFVTRQKEVDAWAKKASTRLEGDGILWLAYPKASSKKYTCEFNRDTGWKVLGELGFEPVRQVAIDEDWSALRFRRVEYIKKMTRGFAMTKVGKDKVAKAKQSTAKRFNK
ncbi:MAG: hypothetical protein KF725_17155 [Cyclobacteriaceae bacterium]|nr:hypothetical protein [Cyclobacteriaceae bacterium]UYN87259.1 MAG: hypothetical protein KIT51_02990 [Cyclobacteriaceae bacterium]